jgi:hypothetical protein
MQYFKNLTDACTEAICISRANKKEYITVMQSSSTKEYYVAINTRANIADVVVLQYLDCEQVNSTSPTTTHMEPETTGDKVDPDINMPVNKNELMLMGLALREYRYALSKNHKDVPKASYMLLMQQLTALEAKVISNEVSWNSMYGGNPDEQV